MIDNVDMNEPCDNLLQEVCVCSNVLRVTKFSSCAL